MSALQQLVESAPSVFSGAVRETEGSLRSLETALGVTLPSDVRWFLASCGSGISSAVSSAKACIDNTLRYRASVALPHGYVVLDDRNDAGSVLLDTESSEGAVIWVDSHAINKVAHGTLQASEHDLFKSFTDWVACCVEDTSDAP